MATRSSTTAKRRVAVKKTTTRARKVAVRKKTTPKKKAAAKSRSKTIKKAAKKITTTDGIKRNPLGHLLMEKMFREAGFRGGISSSKKLLDAYSTDESIFSIRPQVVVQPKNRRDVEIATKIIARETERFSSLSLTPRAAGTGLGGGSLTDSVVLDV